MSKIHLKYDSNSGLTNNQLFKYTTNGSGVTSSVIYDDGTNVGVGIASPLSRLHGENNFNDIVSVIRASNTSAGTSAGVSFNAYNGTNAVEFGILSTTHTTFGASYGLANDVYLRSSSGAGKLNIINSSGNAIVLGSSPATPLMWVNPNTASFGANLSDSLSTKVYIQGGDSTSSNYSLKVDNSTSSPLLYVRNDGNVGIGTTSPSHKLHISGGSFVVDGRIDTSNYTLTAAGINTVDWATCKLYYPGSSAAVDWGQRKLVSTAGHDNLQWTNDLVQIQTTNSVADISSTNGNDLRIVGSPNGSNGNGIFLKAYSNPQAQWRTGLKYLNNGSEPDMCLVPDGFGNVGIGTNSPSQKLHVAGNTFVEGDVNIMGNVNIVGTATTINTQTLQTADNKILLNYSGTNLTSIGGGISILSGRTDGQNVELITNVNGDWTTNTGLITYGRTNDSSSNSFTALSYGGTQLLSVRNDGNVFIGNNTPASVASPNVLDLGGQYSNVNGINPKLVLYNNNNIVKAGLGVSYNGGGQTELFTYAPSSAFDYTWYHGGNKLLTVSPSEINLVRASSIVGYGSAITFGLFNSANTATVYGAVLGEIVDSTPSLEDGVLRFKTITNGVLTEKMAVNQLGYVGIGTPTPVAKLHVEGNMVVSGTSPTSVRVKIGNGTSHMGDIFGADISVANSSNNGRIEVATNLAAGSSEIYLSNTNTSYTWMAKLGTSYVGSIDGISYANVLYISNISSSAPGTVINNSQHHYFIGANYADTYIGDYGIRHSSKSSITSGPNGEIQFYKATGSNDGNGFSRRTMVIGDHTSVGGTSVIGDMLSIENGATYTASTVGYRSGAVVHINDMTPYTAITGNIFKVTKAGTEVLSLAANGNFGISSPTPTAKLDISGSTGYNQLRVRTSFTPSSSGDTSGNIGDIAWDDNYMYVKTNTGWGRSALSYGF